MPVLTISCARKRHNICTNKFCECDCHKDIEVLREEARQRRIKARENAHTAVRDFDHNPDLVNTQTAILALTQYEQTLKEARHGR